MRLFFLFVRGIPLYSSHSHLFNICNQKLITNNSFCLKRGDKMSKDKSKKKQKYIFRASMTINGTTYYAKDYGKKAFKIKVK